MDEEAVVCTRCQSVGLERYVYSGSVRTGLLLLAVLVIPGVLYFIWYFLEGHWGCSSCGSRAVEPLMIPPEQCAFGVEPPRIAESYQLKAQLPPREPLELDHRVGNGLLAG
ncbi:MAG TPA: hypothetical protein VFU55_10330 [Terracidiphilus sp.]|nr:hypothetical protein [Terracidiphilus sp.]